MERPSAIMYIAIMAFVALSAFFSASETSISTFNRIRMKKQAQDGSAGAQRVLDIADDYDRTISAILIGNNIVNIAGAAMATVVATALWEAYGALIATVVMTFLFLTFADIMPKTYCKAHADSMALRLSGPLKLTLIILAPLSLVFTKLGSLFARENPDAAPAPTVTEEDLKYIIENSEEEGVLEGHERELIQSALEFEDKTIREIITPRVNTVALDVEAAKEEITQTIIDEGYSRMPVYEETIDNIIGILYTKNYLKLIIQGETPDLRALVKEPYFVHKGMKISMLLQNLKSRKMNMAVVLDEYGGTMGIVTMEDLLEELVGEIWDEDEEIPDGLICLDQTHYEVTGEYDILEMLTALGYDEDDLETEHNTVSGWAIHQLEHIPEIGESFDYQDLRFTVVAMDGHRVSRLSVEKYPEVTDNKDEDSEGNL